MIWCLIGALIISHYSSGFHPFFGDMFGPGAVFPSLFLAQSMGIYITAPLNTPSWSLSTEWWAYMIFPLLVPFFTRLRATGKILTLLLIICFFLFVKYVLGPASQPFPDGPPTLDIVADFGFFRCLAGFLTGMLLFKVYDEGTARNLFTRSWVFVVLFAPTIVAMHAGVEDILVVAAFPPIPAEAPNYTHGVIVCIVVVALILASMTYRFIEVPFKEVFEQKVRAKRNRSSQCHKSTGLYRY